jgi:hypothetical protein
VPYGTLMREGCRRVRAASPSGTFAGWERTGGGQGRPPLHPRRLTRRWPKGLHTGGVLVGAVRMASARSPARPPLRLGGRISPPQGGLRLGSREVQPPAMKALTPDPLSHSVGEGAWPAWPGRGVHHCTERNGAGWGVRFPWAGAVPRPYADAPRCPAAHFRAGQKKGHTSRGRGVARAAQDRDQSVISFSTKASSRLTHASASRSSIISEGV